MPPFVVVSLAGLHLGWIGAIALWTAFAHRLWRRARRQPGRLARLTDLLGALVCAAVLVFGIVRGPHERPRDVWETAQGHEIRAGFFRACQQNYYGPLACECLFARLTSGPPGNTATGFTMLGQSIRYGVLRDNLRAVRPEARTAVLACRPGQAS